MSVTVRHLNADTSFLLTFSPDPSPSDDDSIPSHGTYTVLIDPWLQGDSVVSHPWFAVTKHNVAPSVNHLSEIEEPDLVIVSQNKPDHCHGETLRQLRPEGKSIIAAEPSAAKSIKSWDHFDPARIFGLPKYSPRKKFSLLRFHIPPLAPGGDPGEVTVAFLPAKNYLTGLHNGIGLTYQAPTAVKTLARVCTVDLPRQSQDLENPFSPSSLPPYSPGSPLSSRHDSRSSDGGVPIAIRNGLLSPPLSPISHPYKHTTIDRLQSDRPPTPPDSPTGSDAPPFVTPATTLAHTPSSSLSLASVLTAVKTPERVLSKPKKHPARPRPISVLYTPHGLPLSDLMPYVQHHLLPLSALPLTLLLHSFSRATNPWYLGGNIMAGSGNGIAIARTLLAKVWLSAHDEDKDDQGFSVKKLRVDAKTAADVRRMLYEDDNGLGQDHKDGERWRKCGWTCDVRDLGVGKSMVIRSIERDLIAGSQKKWWSDNVALGAGDPDVQTALIPA